MSPLDIPLALTGISLSVVSVVLVLAWIVWTDRREGR